MKLVQLYQDNVELTKHACIAIRNLARNDLYTKLDAIALCESTVDSLRLYGCQDMEIAEQGLRTIFDLAVNEENNAKIGFIGGCCVVVDCLSHFLHATKVVEWGLWAICSLATNKCNKELLGACGACKTVLEAMEAHPEISSIAEGGCRAVVNLSTTNINRSRLSCANACTYILNTIRSYPLLQGDEWACLLNLHGIRCWLTCDQTNERVAEQACRAVFNLTFTSSCKTKLLNANAIAVMERVATLYPSGPANTWARNSIKRLQRTSPLNNVTEQDDTDIFSLKFLSNRHTSSAASFELEHYNDLPSPDKTFTSVGQHNNNGWCLNMCYVCV